MRETRARTIAELLINIGAIVTRPENPFVFTSGMKSPIYCDNRLIISFPKERAIVLNSLYKLIRETLGTSWDIVAGVATAGIPFAAWVAAEFDKPMVYVRETQKEHGKQLQIEGKVQEGQVAIVIEDLITTGKSAISAVETLRASNVRCDSCFAIFDYQFSKSAESFRANRIQPFALTNFSALLETLQSRKMVRNHEVEAIIQWHLQANQ